MDGLKLARAVRDRWPPIKIIVTSGFDLIDEKLLPEGSKFIPKPYESARLSSALHEFAL
jgi:two-component system, response regulator PdtaR